MGYKLNKFSLFLISVLFLFQQAFCDVDTYSAKNKFGLIETSTQEKITEPIYSKLIRLKDESYLFLKGNKYGIISKTGEILVEPKYNQAQRLASRFAKLGKNNKFGLYNEFGDKIIEDNYSQIQILYGKMFLVQRNYKYGLISYDGDIILAPIADDIYMPKMNTIKIKYDGIWYEIIQEDRQIIDLSNYVDGFEILEDDLTIVKLIQNPIPSAGYGLVSGSDYIMKLFSSISPAYEQTIDELVLSNGADAVNILIKCSWLYKFPYVYMRNYVKNFKTPNNGPLSEVKIILKSKIK